jgi:Restriction endonuclease
MDDRRRLELDIAALTWVEFQRLVHDLVKKERPRAIPLEAPDGGADTKVPTAGGEPTEVVQAKHYARPAGINWPQCISSLEAAIENHKPGRMTFAFPRDFTKNDERNFRTKLVDPYPQLEVLPWPLSEIIDRLDRNSDLKKRYFGRDREDVLDSVLRAVEQGGRLQTGEDLIARTRALAEFADQHDRDFEYDIRFGGPILREPNWGDLPFIAMTFQDETTTVQVNAWAREGANVPLPGFSFTEDDAGREAHAYAREELAQGRDAVLRQGARVQVPNAPKLLREATAKDQNEGYEITLRASEPIRVEVEFDTETETIVRTFAARPVPPKEPGHIAFLCIDNTVAVEFDFQALEEPTVRFSLTLTGRFQDDVSVNLEAARLLHAFFTHTRHVIRAEGLFPGGELEGQFSPGTENDRRSVEGRLAIYAALARIEEDTGVDFVLPEGFGEEDIAVIRTVEKILENGGGTATFRSATGVVEVHQIAALGDNSGGERILRQPVVYELFGESVNLGIGEYEIPPVRVIDVKPLGTKPDAPARVTIGPEGTDQMPFRLIVPPKPPSLS